MSELTAPKPNIELSIDSLTQLKRDAYAKLDQALNVDQSNETSETKLVLYKTSLLFINKALKYFNDNYSSLSKNENAIKISTQLNEMKKLTLERMNNLETKKSSDEDDFLNISDDILLVDDDDTNDVIIIDSPNKKDTKNTDFEKATELYHLENSVQQFYIATDGTVSTPSHLTDISIYTFEHNIKPKSGKNIVGFIKVADWLYPIVPNEAPGMKTNYNAYIFPNEEQEIDSESKAKCPFIGIQFDKSVSNDQKTFFEDILSSLQALIYQDSTQQNDVKRPLTASTTTDAISSNKTQPKLNDKEDSKSKSSDQINKQDEPRSSLTSSFTAENISKTLLTGADYISKGVNTTVDYASKYIQQGGEKLITQVAPNPEPAKVTPTVQNAVSTIRYGSHLTVRVSNFLVSKLKSIATSTAKTVAPHIRDGSTYLLKQTGVASDKSAATSYIDSTCKVASSAVEGFGIVYDSIEEAAKQLGRNLTQQSVTVVNHKYGPDAAKVAENGLYSVGNVAQSVNNFQNLKVIRTLAKATAKETLSSNNKTNQDVNQDSNLSSQSEKQ